MGKLAVLKVWQQQQESQFEELKRHHAQQMQAHEAHKDRLTMLEKLPNEYQFKPNNAVSALSLKGVGRFRSQIDHLTKLQHQELALSESEMRAMKSHLVAQHRKAKLAEVMVSKHQQLLQIKQNKQEQKMLEELALQRFLRDKS